MSGKIRSLGFALMLLVGTMPAARAENPRISLKVENATFAEAAAALSKASGIPVEHWSARLPQGLARRPEPLLEEKASFDWTNVPFAHALRQLCDHYNLQPVHGIGGGYTLNAAGARAAPPGKLVGLVEKNGMRLFARSIAVYENRSRRLDFLGGGPVFNGSANLSLNLAGVFIGGDGDAETIAGVENLTARDDLGNILESHTHLSPFDSPSDVLFPDEWGLNVTLPAAHPRARKLDWIEGDLMVYRTFRRHRLEFTPPITEGKTSQQVGQATVRLSHFEPGNGENRGPSVEIRLDVPPGSDIRLDSRMGSVPLLEGASGRIYRPSGSGGGGGGGVNGFQFHTEGRFEPIGEPVAKVLFRLVEKAKPEKLLTFRMQDIPLPPEGVFAPLGPAPRPVNPPAPLRNGPEEGAERPYFQEGGGTLVSRIQVQGQPAGEGSLSFGVSQRSGGEWNTIRWFDVEVSGGVARLPDLKPGTYRVLRVYRPKEAPKVTSNGRWVDGEVVAEVTAGKEVSLPPLRWVAEPEARPAGAGRPSSGVPGPGRPRR
jgi:hypothetical protein